ncbi:MAG: helix-turn-helix domain-containing protein [Pseudolabrys sp.]
MIEAAKQGRRIASGKADPKTYAMFIPAKVNVRAIRQKKKMTQEEFALRYGMTVARIRDWEQSRYEPDGVARAYLTVIDRDPKAVERALASA